MTERPWTLVHGDCARMSLIRNGEADLVLTSPPYFSEETAQLLRRPIPEQVAYDQVQAEVTRCAYGLRNCFREIVRILKPDGVLVIQTKDLRYGGFLIELAATHREMLCSEGLRLITRVFWPTWGGRKRQGRRFLTSPRVGAFAADDVEEFLVLGKPDSLTVNHEKLTIDKEEAKRFVEPIWRLPGIGSAQTHPYQSPPAVLHRFLTLYSRPGDLVVDPFTGHGTALHLAVRMGRRAIGYEIEEQYISFARARLETLDAKGKTA